MNQVRNLQATSKLPLTELTPFTPVTHENLDYRISQELDPKEGATVTTPILNISVTSLIPVVLPFLLETPS